MTILEMKKSLNSLLAGEMLSFDMMKQHINFAIDEINTVMDTCFPDISSLTTESTYTAIPDKYIRSVVLPGAAHHYYMVDDEGTTPEQDFARQFEMGKFYMLRDYSYNVPSMYQVADNEDGSFSGSVGSAYEDNSGMRGIDFGGNTLGTRTGIATLDNPLSWEGEGW